MIRVLETGIIFRNPQPNLRAIHAWHPSVVLMNDTEYVASFDLGQGAESFDYATWVSRSSDAGKTWSKPTRLIANPPPTTTHTVRLARMPDGSIAGIGSLHHRRPDEGLINPKTFGFVPCDLISVRSVDAGKTFSPPAVIRTPLEGPFEICHPILVLRDGRWIFPTGTWKGWNGESPNGMQTVAFVSSDQGRTWPGLVRIMDDYRNGVIHFEQGLAELEDGRFVSVAWAFHETSGKTLPTRLAISADGKSFGPFTDAGLSGETIKIISTGGNKVFGLYRRVDQPGLWAFRATVGSNSWTVDEQAPIWQGADANLVGGGTGSNATKLAKLKFGYPSLVRQSNGMVFAAFWCMEDGIQNIRWVRIEIT